jgi:6-phosphogluconolactonase
MKLEVLADKAAVADRAAELLRGASGHVALAGGSTPREAYALAADALPAGVTWWLGDERVVPADDERSNARMVRESLGVEPEAVRTELDPVAAAADYDRRLDANVNGGRFDLVLLGLGPDSHTASLFPGKPELDVRDRLAVAVPEAGMEPFVPRVSLTLTALRAAQCVVFLIAGEDKAEACLRAFGDPPDPASPAAHVRPQDGELLVLADAAAARLLSN